MQIKDSLGNILTQEQIDYFQESKVRDSNGNLLVCFHGSDASFSTFDLEYASVDSKLGLGFYFTKGEQLQFDYDNVYACYINIQKPLYEYEDSDKLSEIIQEEEKLLEEGKTNNEVMAEIISKFDIDGIIGDDNGHKVIVAFNPAQIKSIENKNPTPSSNINEGLLKERQFRITDKFYNSLVQKYQSDSPALGPSFITSDGKYLNLPKPMVHGDIFGDDEDKYETIDYLKLANKYNLIKTNGSDKNEPYPYIYLWCKPTEAQEKAIIDWMYFLISKGKKEIEVNTSYFSGGFKWYKFNEILPEDIYKDMIKYLGTNISYSVESLNENVSLQKATPYMLRNDGELLTCGDIHPYIYYNAFNDEYEELIYLLNNNYLQWFYNNTLNDETKEKIASLLFSILRCEELEQLHAGAKKIIEELALKEPNEVIEDKSQIFDIFYDLNNVTNQEFCRVRTSSLKYGGKSNNVYFRISSIHFNWFDLIWKLLFDNQSFVKDVTICKDQQTFGGRFEPYKIKGKSINNMPVEEFLTLEGNPVIEKFNFDKDILNYSFDLLSEGKSLNEVYRESHPRYANMFYHGDINASLDWDIANILSYHKTLNESLLLEKNRQELINKSKSGREYSKKNQAKGKNRWERRRYSQIANSVRDYNDINMDAFWKGDILDFKVKVKGETDNYIVSLTFERILDELQREVKANNNKLEFKCVLRALLKAFNGEDVSVGCTCPDFTYRFAYHSTVGRYNANLPELRPNRFDWTNKNNDMGSACKHVNLVLSNTDWMMKVASVINNYIKWCKDNMGRNYADYIFPKVYGMPYNRAVQLSLFDDPDDNGLLPSDQDTLNKVINKSLKGRDEKGRWTKDNEFKFQKKNLNKYPEDNPDQLKLDLEKQQNKRIKLPDEEIEDEEEEIEVNG